MTGRDSAIPHPIDDSDGSTGGWGAAIIPEWLARRAISLRLDAPDVFPVGRRTPFRFIVRNRAPVGVALTLPTSRIWGWAVDGVPEAGVGRFDPPEGDRSFRLGPREQRTFTGRWDGRIRTHDDEGDVWAPASGSCELTAHLAVSDWERHGLSASTTVSAVLDG